MYDFNESDLSLTNGSIVANSLSLVRPGVYSFQLSLNNYNQDAVLSLAQGLLTDDPRYAQPNEAAQVTIRKMFRRYPGGGFACLVAFRLGPSLFLDGN